MTLSRIISAFYLSFIISVSFIISENAGNEDRLLRNKRLVVFPQGSSFGYIAAVAIPLDLPGTVYFSFAFEANHGLPDNNTHVEFIEKMPNKDLLALMRGTSGSRNISFCKTNKLTLANGKWHPDEYLPSNISSILSSRKRAARSHPFSTRMNFFASISAYFQHFGYDGEACLLRTICEISSTDLGEYNGAFGSLLHVLFMPSASMNEHLPNIFYAAEESGQTGRCNKYNNKCSISFLDIITSIY